MGKENEILKIEINKMKYTLAKVANFVNICVPRGKALQHLLKTCTRVDMYVYKKYCKRTLRTLFSCGDKAQRKSANKQPVFALVSYSPSLRRIYMIIII